MLLTVKSPNIFRRFRVAEEWFKKEQEFPFIMIQIVQEVCCNFWEIRELLLAGESLESGHQKLTAFNVNYYPSFLLLSLSFSLSLSLSISRFPHAPSLSLPVLLYTLSLCCPSSQYLKWELLSLLYTVKKVSHFPVPSRDVTDQTLPGREKLNYSRPGRVWSVTSRLGTGKRLTLFYSVLSPAPL